MKLYKNFHLLILVFICIYVCSCTDEIIVEETPVEIHTRVNSESDKSSAALFFWDSKTFNDLWLKNQGSPKPIYGPAVLTNDIDYYKNETGNTFTVGLEYPKNVNEYIYATGYAPDNVLEITSDYKTLDIKDNVEITTIAKTDFLCCDGKQEHKGAASDLFTKSEHELKFRHLAPRIRFVGIRDEVMYGAISVNNVKVTLKSTKNLYVPSQFKYRLNQDNTMQTYVASDFKSISKDLPLTQDTQDYIPANSEGLSLMSCYIFNTDNLNSSGYDPFAIYNEIENGNEIILNIDVSADFSWYKDDGLPVKFDSPQWNDSKVKIKLKHVGNCFFPGYEYVVRIIFKRESIILQGVQENWEDGGIHYLPVS